jgi:hypothetical protein
MLGKDKILRLSLCKGYVRHVIGERRRQGIGKN